VREKEKRGAMSGEKKNGVVGDNDDTGGKTAAKRTLKLRRLTGLQGWRELEGGRGEHTAKKANVVRGYPRKLLVRHYSLTS